MIKNTYNITVNETELKSILKGLGKLPFEQVYDLIGNIVKQTAIATPQKIAKTNVKKN